MNCGYHDILSRITEPPKWWDEEAVPRYCAFAPDETANIYADEVALVELVCQACEVAFLVAFSWSRDFWGQNEDGTPWVKRRERMTVEAVKELHYGDPPNFCCGVGATMNSVPRRVVEFWRRHHEEHTKPDERNPSLRICLPGYFDWRRVPELEISIECEWAAPAHPARPSPTEGA